MQAIETEFAQAADEYSLTALIYHLSRSTGLEMEVKEVKNNITHWKLTPDGEKQYFNLIAYGVAIFNATHEQKTTPERITERVADMDQLFAKEMFRESEIPK